MISLPVNDADVFRPLSLADLEQQGESRTDWLWLGYLARANLTLLTSQWKAGKTTLLAMLLDRMKQGGNLAGLPVKAGRAVVLSEEPGTLWLERGRRYDLREHVHWLCHPYSARPRPEQWERLIEQLLTLHQQSAVALVAVDTLASFFPPKCEYDTNAMLEALLALRRLTAAGVSVLVHHHPSKNGGADGMSARSGGALCAHVDISMELHWWRRASEESRRRRLVAWSRHEVTPRHRIIELSGDGREYVVVEDTEGEELAPLRAVVWRLLAAARIKQTRTDILAGWPPDQPKPHPFALARVLERGVERGELKRDGGGVRTDPFRYWLPSLEERWKTDAMARLQQQTADDHRNLRNRTVGL